MQFCSTADENLADIDLVRIYHPDSPVSRALPREVTDGRFQSITKAYDALRGRTVMNPTGFQGNPESRSSKSAAWRAQRARRLDLDAGGDDRWKDKMLLFGAIFVSLRALSLFFGNSPARQTIAAFVAQTMWTRNRALAELRELQDIRTSRHSKKDSREMADSDLDGSSRKS